MELTAQQKSFFDTFGFLAFPGLLKDRIAQITDSFEEIWATRGGGHAGKPHDGKARSCIVPFIDQHEYLCSLLDDPRILAIGNSLLGQDFNYMGSDGNYYVGDTGWHSDGWHTIEKHLKIAFYLDPLTKDSGCLRVIPGSHRVGDSFAELVQQQIGRSQENWGKHGRDVPALPLETTPGDVVVFNHNTKHAAFNGSTHRRMFTINLAQHYAEHRLQALRDYISGHARFWVERNYGEKMMRTAGPERMRHLAQVMANDGHLAELSRKNRESMLEPARG
ncbi:MAG TPA: phytanoyl-CoA dioxygenase family protein [Planctomycetota bacterium]|nr:phytanoyl-CoA dioxygenase family protein [Planctomycetota bacterium]